MIRHIVMFTARHKADVDAIYRGLKKLETIRGDWSLEVAKNVKCDQLNNDIDVVVYGEFPDREALARYKADPVYQQSIEVVRPLRDQRIAVDVPAQVEMRD